MPTNDNRKYGQILVDGKLIFKDSANRHLSTTHLFVRLGRLIIGTSENPFKNRAVITLCGTRRDRFLTFNHQYVGGNKILANLGHL